MYIHTNTLRIYSVDSTHVRNDEVNIHTFSVHFYAVFL